MNQQTTQQSIIQEQTTKRQRKNRRRVNRLCEYWPELFNLSEVRPLKNGVISDMLQEVRTRNIPVGKGALRGAVITYTHMTRYLKAIIAGGPRYGLNGQPCGEVTEEDKSVASELLKRRLEQKNSQQ
ncbi:ProQ/FINO family protein [Escherichia coli]|uniref:ProQ/FINO family protein n=1 Tax=Escherichia coli TaxID=562 RepID=UPI0005EBDC13|nr:ProQ/FINO family protein [Escherichia coli]EEQ8881340.1 prop effector [Escherichia coli]EFJ5378409.1 prop effector [Escherichia coli]EKZ3303936.1 ProQ/FinO family protein [Escherichia coli]HAI8270348.1 prop effector [Escherichia coli]HAI8361556.1 prop effector [Escherichia coli]